ncbi:MAG: proline dehydrogenase, partial [Lewinella sp.]|nr:proline dehydrogenase [Lewinella sp.]
MPVVVSKISALGRFSLLQELQGESFVFSPSLRHEYQSILKRLDAICAQAKKLGVKIFFDAEESWIQDSLDQLVGIMMRRYNTEGVVVYNTFQMYRKDRLNFLVESHERAQAGGYLLGAKLVRGAYLEKENKSCQGAAPFPLST